MGDHESDLLGITEDAQTLADFISARFIEPPLSVGIFGREGSGKSYFAQVVSKRINQNSEAAALAKRDRQDTVRCSNIVQVHYNAWQNAGTNPWIGLTESIITGIDAWAQKSEFNMDQFFSIGTAKKLVQNHELEVKKKQVLVERARKSLAEAEVQFQSAIEQHAQIISANKWSAVSEKLGETWRENQKRDQAGQTLGIKHISKKPEQHAKVLEDAKSLSGRAGLITNSLMTRKYIGNFLLVLVVLIVLSLTSYFANNLRITSGTLKDWLELLKNILTVITSLVAIIGIAVSLFLRNQAAGAIDTLYDDEQRLGDAIRTIDQAQVIETTLAQQKVAVWQREAENRRTRLAEAEGNYVLAQQALDDFIKGDVLKNISDYYRSQILSTVEEFQPGFIPIIREDFHDIAAIMGVLGNSADLGHGPENLPIERIIIFIDDLDQCPPKTNLAMIQVAHLLLSFPLFVVVFIVDPLKLLGVLRPHYSTLAIEESNEFIDTSMVHNEIDYLSKFIQIPFWVRAIEPRAMTPFVRSIIGQEPESTPAPMPTDEIQPFIPDSLTLSETEPSELDLPSAVINIKPVESEFIIQMAEVIGQSPRHVKRFINGYKFILIVQFRKNMRDMTEPNILLPGYTAVLTQLAIVIAAPSAAPYYFKILDETASHPCTFSRFLDELDSNNKIKESGNWPRIRAILDSLSHFGDDVQIVGDLRRWSTEVKLLSYNVPPTASHE